MTLETLKQCRRAAEKRRAAALRLAVHKASAGCTGGMRYDDIIPHGRGEPLAPQEAYVEKQERLQEELRQCGAVLAPLAKALMRLAVHLPYPQNRLVVDYYIGGEAWSPINERYGLNRQQSCYQVRKAFEKILEKA